MERIDLYMDVRICERIGSAMRMRGREGRIKLEGGRKAAERREDGEGRYQRSE